MKAVWLPLRLLRSTRCSCALHPSHIPRSFPQLPRLAPLSSRTLATLDGPEPKAAPEIVFPTNNRSSQNDNFYARIVPVSASYFSGVPKYFDVLIDLQRLLRKYQTLPALGPTEAPKVSWRTLAEIRLMMGKVKTTRYHTLVKVLQRLNCIHPSVMPAEVQEQLTRFKRIIDPTLNIARPIKIDRFGRAVGTGRRKTSTARAWVVEGDGEVLVNGKPLTQAFGRIHDRESAVWPLKATQRLDKYNVWALCEGGGTTGQAEAMTLAVAKALLAHEPSLKASLRRAGCITRDPRKVERKKPGHVKARKMPAWVAR